jgi:GNAT superfamily N-acetyltransferase
MTHEDVAAATFVRKAALEWLTRSQGREPPAWTPRRATFLSHIIEHDAGGSWVAEVDGLVVGFSQAIVRGDIWFLAQLFVLPEAHSAGLGQQLLDRARDYGASKGARVYSVVSSTSPVAQSLYMRAGMFAIGIGYHLSGTVDALRALPEPDANKKRVVDCSGWQDRIAELDQKVFGAERRIDHAFLLSGAASEGWEKGSFGLTRGGEFLGYAYADNVDNQGWIAPIAAHEPADQVPLLRIAADWLNDRAVAEASMWVLSANTALMSSLLGAGWRVNRWSFFLSTERFGQFDRYHPINGLML